MLTQLSEEVFFFFARSFKQNFSDYCHIETVDESGNIIMSDASMLTLIKIDGVNKMVGKTEFSELIAQQHRGFTPLFKQPGHFIQILYECNPEEGSHVVRDALFPSLQTMNHLGLELTDIFDEKSNALSKVVSAEDHLLALWTTPTLLTEADRKKAKGEQTTISSLIRSNRIQHLETCSRYLRVKHESFVESVRVELQNSGLLIQVLDFSAALQRIKSKVLGEPISKDWVPDTYMQRLRPRVQSNFLPVADGLGKLPLNVQLVNKEATELNLRHLRIGNYLFAPLFMNVYPSDPEPFQDLLRRLKAVKDLPFRIFYQIAPGGIKAMEIKNTANLVISWMSPKNRLLRRTIKEFKEIVEAREDVDVLMHINFLTWAPIRLSSNPNDQLPIHDAEILLNERVSALQRSIEGWGGGHVREISGDVKEGFFSTTIGCTGENIGSACALPLKDALQLLPIRPTSYWNYGSLCFRTPDGKLIPYQPFSKEQESNVITIYGPPRYGKSVLLSSLILSLALMPGSERLPLITLIDIGSSSSGVISLIQESLSLNRRHLALSTRLAIDGKMYINPLDLPLGLRAPTSEHRSFLVNLLSQLNTPLDQDKPDIGVPELAGLLIDIAYDDFAKNRAKYYEVNVSAEIDSHIKRLKLDLPEKATWYEVTDALFAAGEIRLATLAQRLAVPLLVDLSPNLMSDKVQIEFGKLVPGNRGETIISMFIRTLTSVARELPILVHPTTFDLGEARIVVFDLQEVAKGDGPQDKRRTSIMYLLARFIGGQHFYINEDILNLCLPLYKKYHMASVQQYKEDFKMIMIDELHRAGRGPIMDQIELDARQGAKAGVGIVLSSHQAKDFPPAVLNLSTTNFFLGISPGSEADEVAAHFGLTPFALENLKDRCRGPGKNGSNLLAKFRTRQGDLTQLVTLTVSPVELWAFSSTKDDQAIRDRLYKKLPPVIARKVLARAYPQGRAADDIEERRRRMDLFDEDATHGIIESIVNELLLKAAQWF